MPNTSPILAPVSNRNRISALSKGSAAASTSLNISSTVNIRFSVLPTFGFLDFPQEIRDLQIDHLFPFEKAVQHGVMQTARRLFIAILRIRVLPTAYHLAYLSETGRQGGTDKNQSLEHPPVVLEGGIGVDGYFPHLEIPINQFLGADLSALTRPPDLVAWVGGSQSQTAL